LIFTSNVITIFVIIKLTGINIVISLTNSLSQVSSSLGSLGLQNPTSAKVGALVIGAGLIASVPYITPFVTGAAALYVLGAGTAIVGTALLATSLSFWNHNNPYVRVAAKTTTLLMGAGLAIASPINGISHILGVSLTTIGSSIAGISAASIAVPAFGRAVTTTLEVGSYALAAASVASVVIPLLV
jgi:hypothetical protein